MTAAAQLRVARVRIQENNPKFKLRGSKDAVEKAKAMINKQIELNKPNPESVRAIIKQVGVKREHQDKVCKALTLLTLCFVSSGGGATIRAHHCQRAGLSGTRMHALLTLCSHSAHTLVLCSHRLLTRCSHLR